MSLVRILNEAGYDTSIAQDVYVVIYDNPAEIEALPDVCIWTRSACSGYWETSCGELCFDHSYILDHISVCPKCKRSILMEVVAQVETGPAVSIADGMV